LHGVPPWFISRGLWPVVVYTLQSGCIHGQCLVAELHRLCSRHVRLGYWSLGLLSVPPWFISRGLWPVVVYTLQSGCIHGLCLVAELHRLCSRHVRLGYWGHELLGVPEWAVAGPHGSELLR
jgi:hypothetical protein